MNAERHPPGRQLRQTASRANAHEGLAVVTLDGLGNAMAREQTLEDLADSDRSWTTELHREHEATERIAHGERVATLTILRAPPAFEVDGPDRRLARSWRSRVPRCVARIAAGICVGTLDRLS